MTNAATILVYVPLILMASFFFISLVSKRKRSYLHVLTMILSGLLICWSCAELSGYVIRNERFLYAVSHAKQIVIAFIPVLMMLLVFGYFRIKTSFPKWFPLLICIIPSITALLCLSSSFHTLITESFYVIEYEPLLNYKRIFGSWNYVHLVYSQLLVFCMAFIIIFQQRNIPGVYRRAPLFITIAMALYIFMAFLESIYLYRNNLDFQLISLHVSMFLFYLASIINHRTDYLNIEKRNIFNHIDDVIFVLDSSGKIVDGNISAFRFMDLLEEPFQYVPFHTIFDRKEGDKRIMKKNLDKYEGQDIYVIHNRFPVIYNLQEYPFKDNNGGITGFYAVLRDVTQNRLLIERVREISGRDLLTGLPNRYYYQKLLKKLDAPDYLPLSIIVGRLNDLRSFNRINGRSKGDSLLKKVSEILGKCRPETGYVARIGGAEFVILMPICNGARARQIINDIKINYYELRHKDFQAAPQLLLGLATKYAAEENINELIEDADADMLNDSRLII